MSRAEDTALEQKSVRLHGVIAARYVAIALALGSGIWAAIELNASMQPAADATLPDLRSAQGVIHRELPAPAPVATVPVPVAIRAAREPGKPLVNVARLKFDDAIHTPYVESIDPGQPAAKDSVRE